MDFFASAPRGVASLLAGELKSLGIEELRETGTGVFFSGPLKLGYLACLWSRLANRVTLQLGQFTAANYDELYQGIGQIDWRDHLDVRSTFSVAVDLTQSVMDHTHFASLRVKDAIVDQFRQRAGNRPDVAKTQPDVRVYAVVRREQATVAIDLSGESLHRRGYRIEAGPAPLKENVAAALLVKAGWPELAAQGGALTDLMCGSGTIPIEGLLMAADIAPGLLRDYFGFLKWRGHDPAMWQQLVAEAHSRRQQGLQKPPIVAGFDIDDRAVRLAEDNAVRAQLGDKIVFLRRALVAHEEAAALPVGLVVANPPYGERLGEGDDLPQLYAQLGACLRANFAGHKAAILTGNPELGRALGLRANRVTHLYNGALRCDLLHFDVTDQAAVFGPAARAPGEEAPHISPALRLDPNSVMFANRLRKNLRLLKKWAAREAVHCYRVYDADMPEYSLAVDLYESDGRFVVAQEYQAPDTVDPTDAARRWRAALETIREVLEVAKDHVFVRQRRRQGPGRQYERHVGRSREILIEEAPCRFWVNLSEYLDTGLFLDDRLIRRQLRSQAKGRDFLNLFGYTGAASVCAWAGGAASTTTVDMSRTYLAWAERNFAANQADLRSHRLVQANCLQWLDEQQASGCPRYGLIFLGPPTFSNSKRMEDEFDLQRDHADLIGKTADLLTEDGVLIFSTHFQRFKMSSEAVANLDARDITATTIPQDFARRPRVHQTWLIKK